MRILPKQLFLLIAFGMLACSLQSAEPDFADSIRPILSENCFQCHGPDQNDRKADLRLDTPEGYRQVLTPGQPDESELIYRVFADDVDDVMPPPESKLTLTGKEKQLLKQWVAAGAPFAEHWSFVKPQRPEVPEGVHPVDYFVGRRLQQAGLDFSPEAPAHQLIRRVTLDLTGLPPTIEELNYFLLDFEARGEPAYLDLIDRLMDSPRYGENMALPWLDAARFADTDGYQFDGPRFMWRWRDWVIDAYNSKKPFDQFTIEQLAGDLLENPSLDQVIATGFNRNHRYNSEAGLVVEEFLLENAVDRVDTTSTLWMGLTVGCARCHDHKYDPISQKDYYQLIAFFNSVPEAGRAVKSKNSEPVILAPTIGERKELARLEAELQQTREALKPAAKPQQGGNLIDRKLLHQFALSELPTKNAKVDGEVEFRDKALFVDGKSRVEIGGLDKSLTFRASQGFTISFHVKPGSDQDCVILARQSPGTTRPGVEVAMVDGGKLQFDLVSRWIAGLGRATSKQALPIGQWTHVTLVNDGSQSANGQKIYFDGKPVTTEVTYNTNSNVGGVKNNVPFLVGGGIRPKSGNFTGGIRDLRIYTTDLWPEEIEILAATYGGEKRQAFSRLKMSPEYAEYVTAREKLEKYKSMLPTVMVMQDTPQPKETFIRNRGVYHDYGEKVSRDVPEKFPEMPEEFPRNRLGFAKWLLTDEHPLTARVAVNRYWQRYFGTGLVKTAEDFGVQGEAPSHPELLDWLAVEFRDSGWDIAAMQKLIVTSRTYRQASRIQPGLLDRDPDNRLLARGPRIRLSGHAIRDQALFVSGLLKERIGGPSVSPYQPANLWAEMSMGMKYRQSKGDDLYRRSLYTIWKRTVAPPTMSVFDAADREACWINRKETNTPLQALTLLNETGFVESARHLAARMLKEGGKDPIGFGFRLVTSREITARERELFELALQDYESVFADNAADAEKLINVGESPQNKEFPATRLAAYTAVANVLLNLDEAITRE